MLASLRTKFLLPTFYVFFRVISKKRKKSCFLKSEKNEKYVFSNTGYRVCWHNPTWSSMPYF